MSGLGHADVRAINGRILGVIQIESPSAVEHVAEIAGTTAGSGKCLRLEFSAAPQSAGAALASAGVLVVNPPWTLAGELKAILPELEKPLGQGGAGRFKLEMPRA